MHSYVKQMDVVGLDDWGRPEDIGAETIDGPIQVSGRIDLGNPEAPVFGGIYAATRGVYRVTYPFHEHATILEGEVELTDESTGISQVFRTGDSWLIRKSTPMRWDIKSVRVVKSYIATTTDIEGVRPR